MCSLETQGLPVTPHFRTLGLSTCAQLEKEDSIVDASGNGIKGKIVGNMPSTVCNKNGQEMCDVLIKGV
eukprot:9229969-Ditylum_brightwellii.AAC.1